MGYLTCRLRPGKDDDIKRALDSYLNHQKIDRSDVIRTALRSYLLGDHGQSTTKKRGVLTDLDNVELQAKEKNDDQLAVDLDSLLNDF